MKEYFVLQLLHKQYTGELEGQDMALLQDWISQSSENKAFSETVKKIWQLSANYTPSVNFESRTESAFDKFSQKIQAEKTTAITASSNETVAKTRTLKPLRWIAGVAAVGLLVTSAFFMMNQSSDSSNLVAYSTIADQKGEKLELVDQSMIYLNEKTNLNYYTETSGTERKVLLEGESYFEVQPSKKPFIIETANAIVTVVGTKFNVDSDEIITKVHVKEGKVELRPKNSSKSILLTENMTGIYNSETKKLYRKQSKSYNGDSWLTGGFSFEDAPLNEVFETLENHYNVDIYVKDKGIETCVFTSPVYQDNTIQEVLNVMQVIYAFDYQLDDERIIISGGICGK